MNRRINPCIARFLATFSFLVGIFLPLWAQSSTPQLALVKTDSINEALSKAIRQNNETETAELLSIKTALYCDRYQIDSLAPLLRQLKEVATQNSSPALTALSHYLQADIYVHALHSFYPYPNLNIESSDMPLEKIGSWSAKQLLLAFVKQVQFILSAKSELVKIPVSKWAPLLTETSETTDKEPSLFLFLEQQLINCYTALGENYSITKAVAQTPYTDSLLFAPVNQFLTIDLDSNLLQLERTAFSLMQSILREEATRDSLVFFQTDLQRLNFAYDQVNLPFNEKRKIYRKALFRLLEENASKPWVIAVFSRWSEWADRSDYAQLKEVLDWKTRLLALHRDESITACIEKSAAFITAPFFELNHSNIFYPKEAKRLSGSFRNLENATLILYRLHCDAMTFEKAGAQKDSIPRSEVYRSSLHLADSLTLTTHPFSLEIPPLDPGIYALSIQDSTLFYRSNFFVTPHLLAEINSREGATSFWVVNGRTGKPLSGVPVAFFAENEKEENTPDSLVEIAKTDRFGLVAVSSSSANRCQLEKDPYAPILTFNRREPYLGKEKSDSSAASEKSPTAFIYTDRSIYRPGDLVQFAAVLYRRQDAGERVLANQTVTVTLYSAAKEVCETLSLKSDSMGMVHASFRLPDDKLTGSYRLEVGKNSSLIEVSAYKRPTFRVWFAPITQAFDFKTPVKLTGKTLNYAGGTLSDGKVRYRVTRLPRWYAIGFVSGEEVASGETLLNEKGSFSIEFIPQKLRSDTYLTNTTYTYAVTASVTSANGETQTATTFVTVGDAQIALRINLNSFFNKNTPPPLGVKVTNLNGSNQAIPCKLILYSLYDTRTVGSYTPLDSLKINTQVYETDFTAPAEPTPPQWEKLPSGAYRVVVQGKDPQGRIVSEEKNIEIYGDRDKRPPVASALWIPQKRYRCKAGDKVSIGFGSSLKNTAILCALYDGNRCIERQLKKLSNKNTTYKIEYKETFGSELTLLLWAVIDQELYQEQIIIQRENPDARLSIQTETFRNHLSPGAVEQWRFRITDAAGKPVSARFMAEMYDMALDPLRLHNWQMDLPKPSNLYPGIWVYLNRREESNYGTFHEESRKIDCDLNPKISWRYSLCDPSRFGAEDIRVGYGADGENSILAMRNYKATASYSDAKNTVVKEVQDAESSSQSTLMPIIPIAYRTQLNETAFFEPALQTDSSGNASLSFTVPQVSTTWRFLALAYTPDLTSGTRVDTVLSRKPLAILPNMPRFVRQGDQVKLSALLMNTTDSVQKGEVLLTLFDPYSDKNVLTQQQTFILLPQESQGIWFEFETPLDTDLTGIRIGATSQLHSDGEQHLLPILPTRTLVTETMPFIQSGKQTKSYRFKTFMENKSESLENYRLTLEYTGNPIWFVVQSLPALSVVPDHNPISIMASYYGNSIAGGIAQENPRIAKALEAWKATGNYKNTLLSQLDKNESLKNLLLSETPWVLNAVTATERMQAFSALFDTSEVQRRTEQALEKLEQLQQKDGGWSWMKGFHSSPIITLNTLEGFARISALGFSQTPSQVRIMQQKALRYLDNRISEERRDSTVTRLSDLQLIYLYVRVKYPDIPLTEPLLSFHKQLIERIQNQWRSFSVPAKAMAAVILHGYGFADQAKEILEALTAAAIQSPQEGVFWKTAPSSANEGVIRIHTLLLAAYAEIDPQSPLLNGMKRWLLLQKQANDWGSFPATMDAIYALLHRSEDHLGADTYPFELSWGGAPVQAPPEDPLTDYLQSTKQGDAISAKDGEVTLTTAEEMPAWGALYWQYFEEFGRIPQRGSGIHLRKSLFVERIIEQKSAWIPLEKTRLQVGDKVMVVLNVSTDQNLSYVSLIDQHAACFEPTDPHPGKRINKGIPFYEENRDASTRLFFESLPKGSYQFRYEVWIDRSGTYHLGVSNMQSLYAPQYSAFTQGGILIVK